MGPVEHALAVDAGHDRPGSVLYCLVTMIDSETSPPGWLVTEKTTLPSRLRIPPWLTLQLPNWSVVQDPTISSSLVSHSPTTSASRRAE